MSRRPAPRVRMPRDVSGLTSEQAAALARLRGDYADATRGMAALYGGAVRGAQEDDEAMGKAQRDKGKRGEVEFSGRVQELLGIECSRRLGQERDGGSDVHVAELCAVQVKRAESVRLHEWLAQAVDECPDNMLAALAWRRNGGEWIVAMPLTDWASLVRDALPERE